MPASRPLCPEDSWYPFLLVAEMQEGFGQIKHATTSLGLEPATFQLLAASTNYANECHLYNYTVI